MKIVDSDRRRIFDEGVIVNRVFKARNLGVRIHQHNKRPVYFVTPTTVVYSLKIPMSVKGDNVIAQQDDITSYIKKYRKTNGIKTVDPESGVELDPVVRIDRYDHSIEINRPTRDMLPYSEILWEPKPFTALCGLRFESGGVSPVLWNLSSPNQPHALIAGTTGSGKTNELMSIILSLSVNNSPADLRFSIVDPKRSKDIKALQQSRVPHVHDIVNDLDQSVLMIKNFASEMEMREKGLVDRNACHVLVIEEMASFKALAKKDADELEKMLSTIGTRCREANMNVVICMQKPTADGVGSQLKSQIALRLVGAMTSNADALTAVNIKQSGAEFLPGYGAMIYRLGRTMFRFQAGYISNPMEVARTVRGKWNHIEVDSAVDSSGFQVDISADSAKSAHLPVVENYSCFPIGKERALSAEESEEVRRLSKLDKFRTKGELSMRKIVPHVYGSRNPVKTQYVRDALELKAEDQRQKAAPSIFEESARIVDSAKSFGYSATSQGSYKH